MTHSSSNNTETSSDFFGNILVIGLGMIGGSFAKALKSRNLAKLYGSDRRHEELTLGVATHVIDEAVPTLTAEIIQQMDVILLATPVRAMESVLLELKPILSEHTLVTDVGSTKGSIVAAAKSVFGEIPDNFIPGHPIAGAEKNGVLAANENLFEHHKVILTPLANSDPNKLDLLHRLWASIGAEVLSMDVEHHDNVLANSSHLPHLLAYTLVDALANSERSQDIFRFAAGGFRDFTRIASSDPTMWRDIFLANKDATLASLDNFIDHLNQIKESVQKSDGPAMFGVFTRAKSARDHFLRLQNKGAKLPSKPVSLQVMSANLIKGKPDLFGDKLLSQKALVLAAVAEGVSHIENIDRSESVNVTLQALRDMGVVIEDLNTKGFRVHGVGIQGLKAPIAPINVHESGLSLYALLPVLAVQSFKVSVIGEGKLLNHPHTELLNLIRVMGVDVKHDSADCLPFHLNGKSQNVEGLHIELNASSEWLKLSAVLAMIVTEGRVDIDNVHSIANTTTLLNSFACSGNVGEAGMGIANGGLQSVRVCVPQDTLKISWFTLLACLAPGSDLTIYNACVYIGQGSYFDFLAANGAKLNLLELNKETPDFANSFNVHFSGLKAFYIKKVQVAALQNELLLLCVAAVYAKGVSRVEGINSLPYYLQDQVFALMDAFEIVGITCRLISDVLEIEGGIPSGGELDCAGDYFLALAMLALGVRSKQPIIVHDCQKLLEEFKEFEVISEQVGFYCQVTS